LKLYILDLESVVDEKELPPKNVLPNEVLLPKEVLSKNILDQFEHFENTLEICS